MGKASNRKKERTVVANRHVFHKITVHSQSAPFTRVQADRVCYLFQAIDTDNLELCKSLSRTFNDSGSSIFDFGFTNRSIHRGKFVCLIHLAVLARSYSTAAWLVDSFIAEGRYFSFDLIVLLSDWLDEPKLAEPDRILLTTVFGKFADWYANLPPEERSDYPLFFLSAAALDLIDEAAHKKNALSERGDLAAFVPIPEKRPLAPNSTRL